MPNVRIIPQHICFRCRAVLPWRQPRSPHAAVSRIVRCAACGHTAALPLDGEELLRFERQAQTVQVQAPAEMGARRCGLAIMETEVCSRLPGLPHAAPSPGVLGSRSRGGI